MQVTTLGYSRSYAVERKQLDIKLKYNMEDQAGDALALIRSTATENRPPPGAVMRRASPEVQLWRLST